MRHTSGARSLMRDVGRPSIVLGPFSHAWSLRSPTFYIPAVAIILMAALLPELPQTERIAAMFFGVLAVLGGYGFARALLLTAVWLRGTITRRFSYLYCAFIYYSALACAAGWAIVAALIVHRSGVQVAGFRLALLIVPLCMAMTIGAGEVIRNSFSPGDGAPSNGSR
jgi:hypothetical protein